MHRIDIPRKSIYRLSIYQRCLQRLSENEVETVSSAALSKAAGVKSTQLRKDLGYLGPLGTRGLGYNVKSLSKTLSQVLGRTKLQPVILVGVGQLGSALMRYEGFRKEGFEIVAAFDIAPRARVLPGGMPVRPMEQMPDFVKEHQVKMSILTVPATSAQSVANDLVSSGVQAILNFSPIVLEVPKQVVVNNVDLAVELENLSYFIS